MVRACGENDIPVRSHRYRERKARDLEKRTESESLPASIDPHSHLHHRPLPRSLSKHPIPIRMHHRSALAQASSVDRDSAFEVVDFDALLDRFSVDLVRDSDGREIEAIDRHTMTKTLT